MMDKRVRPFWAHFDYNYKGWHDIVARNLEVMERKRAQDYLIEQLGEVRMAEHLRRCNQV